ncbi:MAG: hypothetical protein NZO58_12795 [Gemmataceae bacterium]|nr:hypothetical protein [Gemmataceae bacterium]
MTFKNLFQSPMTTSAAIAGTGGAAYIVQSAQFQPLDQVDELIFCNAKATANNPPRAGFAAIGFLRLKHED